MTAEQKEPLRVVVSGAAGQIGYALIPLVASGKCFGENQPVILHLLDIAPMMKSLSGVVMEIQDCAYPLVRGIVATADYDEAFTGANYAILVGGFPRKKGMLRSDLLAKNSSIYSGTGQSIEKVADRNVKILVVANPANTNALVLAQNAPSIPKTNITSLTRLDMNRADGIIAAKVGANPNDVSNIIIWGNHSKTQVPDALSGGQISGAPVSDSVPTEYLLGEFIPTIQNRGAEVINARGLSSAMSAANAIKDHVHDWHFGTNEGEYVSMGVWSSGNSYGIAGELIYSFPVSISADGQWKIVDGLDIDDKLLALMKETEAELLEEKSEVPQKQVLRATSL